MLYTLPEILLILAAAIIIDWIIGDPRWPTHPVIHIGRLIKRLERVLLASRLSRRSGGIVLTVVVLALSFVVMFIITYSAAAVHSWLGYAVSAWFISTTIAVRGLKEAAMQVYQPLVEGRLEEARKYAGYIVGRDTQQLNEQEAARAAIETVSENTVDALVSPLFYALLGGAPLAMLYRAANTLDSMVGYKNDKYREFGWCSARTDDVLNWLPARLTGLLLVAAAALSRGLSAPRAWGAIRQFAHKHPSPNSGIPESAVAGALGIELGGVNWYFGQQSERARMGWPHRPLEAMDIKRTIRLLYLVSLLLLAGVLAGWLFVYSSFTFKVL